jgi:hypothetical protein
MCKSAISLLVIEKRVPSSLKRFFFGKEFSKVFLTGQPISHTLYLLFTYKFCAVQFRRNIVSAKKNDSKMIFLTLSSSVADPGRLSRIPDLFHPENRIQGKKDPGSRVRIRIKEFKDF